MGLFPDELETHKVSCLPTLSAIFWADLHPKPLGVQGQHILLPQIHRERELPLLGVAPWAGAGEPLPCMAGRLLCPC